MEELERITKEIHEASQDLESSIAESVGLLGSTNESCTFGKGYYSSNPLDYLDNPNNRDLGF